MINIRYHIVSLVAVFLALAIGIAMGSTVISKATVSDLKHRIGNAEAGIRNTKATNRALQGQLDSLQSADAAATQKLVPVLVAGKLTGTKTLVIATPDVNTQYVQQTVATLRAAGTTVEGTITFDRHLADLGKDPNTVTKLQDLLASADPTAKTVTDPVQLWQMTAARLGGDLSTVVQPAPAPATTLPTAPVPTPPGATATTAPATGTTTAAQAPTAFLNALRDAGFVEVDATAPLTPSAILAGSGYQVVVLGEPVAVPGPGTPAGFDPQFMVPLVQAMTKAGSQPVVVGSFADPGPSNSPSPDVVREVFLAPFRSDKALDSKISSVNNLETSEGQVVLVLSLVEVESGKHGHYGVGSGANAVTPTFS